jgi:hypothetical protein
MRRILEKIPKHYLFWLLAVVAVVIVLYLVFGGHNTPVSTIPGTTPKAETSADNQSPARGSDSSSNTNSNPAASTSPKQSAAAPSPTSDLTLDEAQTFVSNHTPGQNGSSTTEQSTCNTTPGATCYIEFSKEGVVKRLDSQVADSSGQVIWNWDVNKAGLTSGSWSIKAVAELNGQVKSVTDARSLVIQ